MNSLFVASTNDFATTKPSAVSKRRHTSSPGTVSFALAYTRFSSFLNVFDRCILDAAKKELHLTYGLMKGNSIVTVVLGMCCTFAFCLAQSSWCDLVQLTSVFAKSAVWYFLFGYHFDIANQLNGVEEDKLNGAKLQCKKNRPLATGEMTIEGGKKRWIWSGVLFLLASWMLGGVALTIPALWLVVTTFSLYGTSTTFGGHFLIKNYYGMSSAAGAVLLAARTLAGGNSGNAIAPIVAAFYIGMIMDIQDFRDEEGDSAMNRKTTSVLLGVKTARRVWGIQFIIATVFFGSLIGQGLSFWPDSLVALSALALLMSTLCGKSARDDDKSYKNFVFFMFLIFLRSPFWAQAM